MKVCAAANGGGGKRGILPHEHAAVVSPILQTFSRSVAFQATIVDAENRRKIGLIVDVYAISTISLTPDAIQQTAHRLMPMLQKIGWKSGSEPTTTTERILKETEASTDAALRELARDVAGGNAQPQSSPQFEELEEEEEEYAPADVDTSLMETWQSQQQELDQMFEEIQSNQLADLPDIPMPKQFGKLHCLYEYQRQGIKWMYRQETSDSKPSWFKRMNDGKWICTVSGLSQLQDPHPIRGGVLADGKLLLKNQWSERVFPRRTYLQLTRTFLSLSSKDMGLGKILQTLGLILSNPPHGTKAYPYKERGINSNTAVARCTLIVCPVTVISNWLCQIRKHVNDHVDCKVLKVGTYHGANRGKTLPLVKFNKIDILLTSYHTLAADLRKLESEAAEKKKQKKRKNAGGKDLSIFQLQFHRTILDEAHVIRSGSRTDLFKAPMKLRAKYRWCLTGTPFVSKGRRSSCKTRAKFTL